MSETPTPKTKRVHCNECAHQTNHAVLYTTNTYWSDDIGDGFDSMIIEGGTDYTVCKCLGCDNVHFEKATWFSEDTDAAGRPNVSTTVFPPRQERRRPDWFRAALELTPEVRGFLKEIYIAYDNGAWRLAAMGIRALVELVMRSKVGDEGNNAEILEAFVKQGYLAPASEPILRDKLKAVGDAVAHRGYEPKASDLSILLEIAETLIATIYVHPERANVIGQIPARPKRQK